LNVFAPLLSPFLVFAVDGVFCYPGRFSAILWRARSSALAQQWDAGPDRDVLYHTL